MDGRSDMRRKGRGRVDVPMEHLSADRLADIISTDRAASPESDPATMRPGEAHWPDLRAEPPSADAAVDTVDESEPLAWEPTPSETFSEPAFVERVVEEPAFEEPAFEVASFEERVADGRRRSPRAVADPVVVAQATSPGAGDGPDGAWVGGRHRRPKGRRLNFRGLALTSVLLGVMGVLTLIVVVTAMF